MTAFRTSRWSWTRTALRVIAGLQAILVLTQAALAGQFLSGNGTARDMHRELGTEVITWVAFVALVLAVLAWRPGRYSAWPTAATALAFGAVVLQLGYGFQGRVDVHIPLGVAIFAIYLALCVALPRPREPKGGVS